MARSDSCWKPFAAVAVGASLWGTGAVRAAEPTPARQHPTHEHKPEKATPSPSPGASSEAAPVPAGLLAPPAMPALTPEQMGDAVQLDAFTVPTPGELFAALNKQCKPNWTSQARGPINTAYSDRAQAALNLGGLIADGYIAVEAQDGQQVKNIGRDILALANTLGIKKEILARGASLQQFAEDGNWASLREELESTQNEVKAAMEALHDDELITLVSIGGWIRGTQVVTDVVLKNFSQATSCILRQPTLVDFLRAKLAKLSPRTRDTALLKAVDAALGDMAKTVSFPLGDTPTKEQVQTLHDQATKLVELMASKKEG